VTTSGATTARTLNPRPAKPWVLPLPLVRRKAHLQSPLPTRADHLADDVHEGAGDQGGDGEPRRPPVGEGDDREASGDPPRPTHERPGAGHDGVGAT